MISIIITAYNVQNTIGKAIDSCLSQSFKDFEIIIVNDCSTDNTLSIILSYDDPRIKLINNDVNLGAGLSRRVGIQEALGEYTTFLDGDDYLDKNYLESLYNTAVEHNADIVSSGLIVIDDKGKIVKKHIHEELIKSGKESLFSTELVERMLNNKLIKRTLWDTVTYSSRRYIEDTQTCFALRYIADKVINIPYAGYYYLLNNNSLCHTSNKLKDSVFLTLCAKDMCEFVRLYDNNNFFQALPGFMYRVKDLKTVLEHHLEDMYLYSNELAEIFAYVLLYIIK